MISNALLLLGAAILVVTLFHSFKLPPIVAFITAGVAIGPFGLKLVNTSPQVGLLTEVAAVLLMFTIGLEFSLKELMRFRRSILILGIGQMLITFILFTLIFWLGFSMLPEKAIFLSFLIAPSSTAVVLKLLYDNREFDSPYGKATFSVLLLQDIAIIPMMVAIPFLVSRQSLTDSFLESIFPLILLASLAIVILYLLSKYALPFVLHRISTTGNREIFFFSVLFIVLGSAALTHQIGLSVSLGAFVAGMLLAGSHYGKQATAEILPLRDSFMSLFFIAVGMMLDLNFLSENFLKIIAYAVVVIALKSAVIFSVTWFTGSSGSVARAVTVLLFQFGEFSFIIAELGTKNNLISESDKQIFVAVAILSLILTPFLYKKIPAIMHTHRFDSWRASTFGTSAHQLKERVMKSISGPVNLADIESNKTLENHVVIIGYGVAGQSLARVLAHIKQPYQIIEMNAKTVRINSEKIPIVYGDATNIEQLKQAGIERARLAVIVTTGVHMLSPILNSIRLVNENVPVIARTNYLLDLHKLKETKNAKFVVSELEATLQVIDLALKEFKLEGQDISELTNNIRSEFS